MRSDLKTGHTQKNTERAGQAEKALYLLNTISAITDRGNNAEVRRKKDGSLTVYEVKKNIVKEKGIHGKSIYKRRTE